MVSAAKTTETGNTAKRKITTEIMGAHGENVRIARGTHTQLAITEKKTNQNGISRERLY